MADFFSLAGSAFAHLEDSPPVPGYENLSKMETFLATTREVNRLGIYTKLSTFSSAVNAIHAESRSAAYYLVQLNLTEQKECFHYPIQSTPVRQANIAYSDAEKRAADGEQMQVVLVAAGSVDSLRRAYPNYFLDTHDFLRQLQLLQEEL